ncbi:MAG TPA: hypothetical protein VGF67_08075 [Ktedonobacteraceae bacterium]
MSMQSSLPLAGERVPETVQTTLRAGEGSDQDQKAARPGPGSLADLLRA